MIETLWSPSESRVKSSQMYKFFYFLKDKYSLPGECDYDTLYKFSVNRPQIFWSELFSFYKVSYEGSLSPACDDLSFKSYSWFPNVSLNFAQNLLAHGKDSDIALSAIHENQSVKDITYQSLRYLVWGLCDSLKKYINSGDVLACYMPNISETAISMLATTALGGVFTSTSCDFGIEGVVDRFGQSKPKVLVAASSYEYGGKSFNQLEKILEISKKVSSIEKIVIVDFLGTGLSKKDISHIPNAVLWSEFFKESDVEVMYVQRKFSDALYIMYSSGTTGKPKCIVHGVGGTLLQHIKELGLHTDLTKDKNIFFFTTCGWMMWNWLISSLYFGAKVSLYEGSPAHPSFMDYLKLIETQKINIFGTSPKFLKALQDSQSKINEINLETLETILSTGAPLLPEQYDYIYNDFKKDVLLASISGGTDILGCFFLGSPISDVVRGELQVRGLGMDVACFDAKGIEVNGLEGELVCKKSFPSRPIYFLDDQDGERINKAYFNEIPGVWHHGDFIQITDRGSAKVLGRSDATLNPGGVRIGTAEIYRQTETLDFVMDSLCIGVQVEGDVEVVLFVKTKDQIDLDALRIKEIKKVIKDNTTPRHIPRRVFQISDIPYTRSGKKMELAITRIMNNKELTNIEAVSNPECLNEYYKIRDNYNS